jgi:hypothetical protein
MADYRDDDWPIAPDPEQPDPGKNYVISFVRAKKAERFGGRHKIELHFVIIEPVRWAKKMVIMYFAVPAEGPPSTISKYYEFWCKANKGKAPERNDRMTPLVFHGYWKAELGHTKRRMGRDGKLREIGENEVGRLVILNLIERTAGAPRAPLKRGVRSNPG